MTVVPESGVSSIDAPRLRRMLTAIRLASEADYDGCLGLFDGAGDEDRFAEFEISFSVFIRELANSKAVTAALLARQGAAARELKSRIDTIQEQVHTIRELSSPTIEIWDGVLCLPIVGNPDADRSAAMTELLLDSVIRRQARAVIIDVTGVELVDTRTADQLVRLSKSVRLLGAECLLSGINPDIALTLTRIGMDLQGLETVPSLCDALQVVLRRRAAEVRDDFFA